MSKHRIQFCENNFDFGTDELVERLESELEDVEVSVDSCLGYCGDCAISPFCLIDDELIQADTADELYEEIKSYIE